MIDVDIDHEKSPRVSAPGFMPKVGAASPRFAVVNIRSDIGLGRSSTNAYVPPPRNDDGCGQCLRVR